MMFIIETPISQVPKERIEEKILFIHPESDQFTPSILMDKYHKNIDDEEKHALAKQIPHHIGRDSQKNLVKYFFNEFMDVEHSISVIKDNF